MGKVVVSSNWTRAERLKLIDAIASGERQSAKAHLSVHELELLDLITYAATASRSFLESNRANYQEYLEGGQ